MMLRPYCFVFCLFATLCCLVQLAAVQASPPRLPNPFKVIERESSQTLNAQFEGDHGWTGADAAWTYPISPEKTVWTFGDTWIGKIEGGKHINAAIVNNTVAVHSLLEPSRKFSFYWNDASAKPESFFQPDRKETWFWPGCGLSVHSKLFFILHRIKRIPAKEPDFGFLEDGDVLCRVNNPEDPPPKWRMDQVQFPDHNRQVQIGNACLIDGDFAYFYCSYRPYAKGANKHPLILARITRQDLQDLRMDKWTYFCHSQNGSSSWTKEPLAPVIMFPDAASEMSVTQVAGIAGFVAIYIPAFGRDVLMRHSSSPAGPWSDPLTVYACKEDFSRSYVYAAKAHPELASKAGELVVSYCRNTKFFADQVNSAELYRPRVVRILIANRS